MVVISPTHYTADVLQFLMPNGRQHPNSTELPIATKVDYDDMVKQGCRFEAEMLTTGHVSVTISNPQTEEDIDISVTANGPEVQNGMVEMLSRRKWMS